MLPTSRGQLHVFEPRYLQLFEDLATKAGAPVDKAQGLRFGHILDPAVAPASHMADAVGESVKMPRLAVLATVKAVERTPMGTLLLDYEVSKRIKLLSIWQTQPYLLAAACFVADSVAPSDEVAVEELEWELYRQLQEVDRLNRQLQGSQTGLPESVHRYAPPVRPSRPRTIADYLSEAGHPAGAAISMWQRHGSVYGNLKQGRNPVEDPYAVRRSSLDVGGVLTERLGKDTRQELFSFAAAGMLELGQAEALALLASTDRAARLRWVSAAVGPFLEQQRAKASVERALKGSNSSGGGSGGGAAAL
ncbi:hypothetical protein GPECTOR_99g814 [Gonium pectorale]|uniref:Lon N-terminal domain-containing protein n=1 Tax=Gonium pectorale TaxID=33097 RepID=A0A150G007_GONPE|nr:hypothetical protein GPECTOR_99g814 [Gonium pectorale]|eukprot:KXZ43179.1 hypothetical protein GPECTOR_99g814 [Gonium pectorale]